MAICDVLHRQLVQLRSKQPSMSCYVRATHLATLHQHSASTGLRGVAITASQIGQTVSYRLALNIFLYL